MLPDLIIFYHNFTIHHTITTDSRSVIGSWDKPLSRLKDKSRGLKDERGVLTCTVRSLL